MGGINVKKYTKKRPFYFKLIGVLMVLSGVMLVLTVVLLKKVIMEYDLTE